MSSTVLWTAGGVVWVAVLVAVVATSHLGYAAFLVLLPLFVLATRLSRAGRLTVPLQSFVGQPVSILVWGGPLSGNTSFTLTSVRAVGAGLHLYLQPASGTSPSHLKVAQPSGVTPGPSRIVITGAAYVQWNGRKVQRSPTNDAVVIALS